MKGLVDRETLVAVRRTSVGTVYRIVNYDSYNKLEDALAPDFYRPERPKKEPTQQPTQQPTQASIEIKEVSAKADTATDTPTDPNRSKVYRRKVVEKEPKWIQGIPKPPDELRSDEFDEVWSHRMEERIEKGAKGKMTATQAVYQFKRLLAYQSAFGSQAMVSKVEAAINGGWQGIVFDEDMKRVRAQLNGSTDPDSSAKRFQPQATTGRGPRRRIE